MKKGYEDVSEEAQSLVNTSVDDMKSGLYFYQSSNPIHVAIIERGLKICKRRGEKTKAKLLESKLKNMKKAPIGLSATSPKSKTDLGEEDPGVCSLGYDMRG